MAGRAAVAAVLMVAALTGATVAQTPEADPARVHWERGIKLYAEGDARGAVAAFGEAIALRPDFAEAYSDRCSVQVMKGSSDLAWASEGSVYRGIEDCSRAIALSPDFAPAFLNRGYGYMATRDYDQAMVDLDKAIALDPGYAEAYGNRGMVYYKRHDNGRALADFEQAVALAPGDWRGYFFRAMIKSRLGDAAGATADCTQALKLDPQKRDALRYTADFPDTFGCKVK